MAFRQQPGSFRCEACPISQADFLKNFHTDFQINKKAKKTATEVAVKRNE